MTVTTDHGEWHLEGCCNTNEIIFIALYFAYGVLIHCLFHRTDLLYPFKLLAVFVHEMSHASAAWLTCGKVKGIEVYANEAGVAKYQNGCQAIVIPAGYVGGAFWGGAFVALSGHRIGATVAACIVSAALLIALAHNPNKVVVYISIGFSILTIGVIMIDWFVWPHILSYFTLFYGVFFGYYAVKDIWDDTVKETKEGSDAVACSDLFKCCRPKCVGIQFLIVSFLFQVLGIYLALVWLVTT